MYAQNADRPPTQIYVSVNNPQTGDALVWDVNTLEWINQSIVSFLPALVTDSSLQGNGTLANPVGLATQTTSGTYPNASYTFNNRGVLTGVTPGAGTISTNSTDFVGNGSSSSVLGLAPQSSGGTYPNASYTFNSKGILTGATAGGGTISASSDFSGNGSTSSQLALATQSSSGVYTNAAYTVNGKGLITSAVVGGGTINASGTDFTGNGSSSSQLQMVQQASITPGTYTGILNATVLKSGVLSALSQAMAAPYAGTLTAGVQTTNAVTTTMFRIQTVLSPLSVYHFKYHIVAASSSSGGGCASFSNEVFYATTSGSLVFQGRGTQFVAPSATSWSCVDVIGASNQIDINVTGSSPYFVTWTGWVELYSGTV